jgi:Pyruvate/2-oxoacid:ferredoxin oxidoreductase delta subunit
VGHAAGKDLYRRLGKKIDGLSMKAPWNRAFGEILRELYTPEEAELAIRIPFSPSNIEEIRKTTKIDSPRLENLLESLSEKGLVMDMRVNGEYYYMLSPIIIGIFEFTMMRTGDNINPKEWARMFHDYLNDDDSFLKANLAKGQKVMPLRTLPYAEAINEDEFVEVLDYEKATEIVKNAAKFAVGICSCRHEKMHIGEKECDIPLETCLSFDSATDFLLRHNMAKEISREETLDLLEKSKEMRLVLNADNVKQGISFICQCCSCCCNILQGIKKHGYPNTIVTSSYIAKSDPDICSGCEQCAEACPIDAITMSEDSNPRIDSTFCMGCGVCALECDTGAMSLVKRSQRVLHPEDTLERVILQCLERGTLQNQMFSNPDSLSHKFMRGVTGAFLRLPPVKKALMSDTLRSRFLDTLKKHA